MSDDSSGKNQERSTQEPVPAGDGPLPISPVRRVIWFLLLPLFVLNAVIWMLGRILVGVGEGCEQGADAMSAQLTRWGRVLFSVRDK